MSDRGGGRPDGRSAGARRARDLASLACATPADALVALLIDDGATAPPSGSPEAVRRLVFSMPSPVLILEVEAAGDARSVSGAVWPAPAGGGSVTVRGTGAPPARVDARGRFRLGPVRPGPFSVQATPPARAEPIVTEWVTL